MKTQEVKPKENQSRAVANSVVQEKNNEQELRFVDNRKMLTLSNSRIGSSQLLQKKTITSDDTLQKTSNENEVIQGVIVAGIDVDGSQRMPTWTQDDQTYHINLTTATYHVTKESSNPKIHYFFKGSGQDIEDKVPTKKERGRSKVKVGKQYIYTKQVFSALPQNVQDFIKTNYLAILAAVD